MSSNKLNHRADQIKFIITKIMDLKKTKVGADWWVYSDGVTSINCNKNDDPKWNPFVDMNATHEVESFIAIYNMRLAEMYEVLLKSKCILLGKRYTYQLLPEDRMDALISAYKQLYSN